jgi:hypothetical protein
LQQVLLVKMPGFLADAWAFAQDGETVAELVTSSDGKHSLELIDSAPYFAIALEAQNQKSAQFTMLAESKAAANNANNSYNLITPNTSSTSSTSLSSASGLRGVAPVAMKTAAARKVGSGSMSSMSSGSALGRGRPTSSLRSGLPRRFLASTMPETIGNSHVFVEEDDGMLILHYLLASIADDGSTRTLLIIVVRCSDDCHHSPQQRLSQPHCCCNYCATRCHFMGRSSCDAHGHPP